MASYGHRNKQALYKPTDFTSQQKKAQMRENQKEKTSSEEGSVEQTGKDQPDSSLKKVTILKPPQTKAKSEETNHPDPDTKEKPEGGAESGVSRKPASSSKVPGKEKPQEKSLPKDQRKKPTKEQKKKVEKSEDKSEKKPEKLEDKSAEKPEGVSNKDLDRIQKLREFMEKQQLADQPKATKEKGKDPKQQETGSKKDQTKDAKSNASTSKNQRNGRSKGKLWTDDSKSDGFQKRSISGKRPPPSGQNKKPQGETKLKEKISTDKDKKLDGSSGAKPKHSNLKGENGNTQKQTPQQQQKGQELPKKNQGGNYNRNYSGPNNQRLPNNASSILGNPYQAHPIPNLPPHHVKQQQQQNLGPFPGPTLSVGKSNKPHITVQASKDKNEHKKSLDFVKNFFNTDPEVQYHRQKNAEKASQASIASSATVSSLSTTTTTGFPNTVAASNALPKANPYMSPDTNVANFMNNHHHHHHSSHRSQQSQQHSNSIVAHNMQLPLSMPSNFSNLSNFYHQTSMSQQSQIGQQNVANTTFSHGTSNPLQQQQQQQQRNSPGSYHAAIGHSGLPQSHQQRNFDIYSSINQNPPHHSQQLGMPNSHFPVRSHASSANNVLSNNYNMGNSYSNYFPSGSPHSHSHVFHVQQEVDQTVISSLLENPKKPKKWQQKVLSKCGPIDSQQARSLINELIDGSYECMVCCDSIKFNNAVWSCTSCFHIFHLHCIRKWAKSEAASVKDQNGWRCPGCQNISTRPPNKYFCFCGKVRDPDWTPRDGITPHSCGEVCKRKRTCDHNCNELCHPGPCPSCPVMVTKFCFCKKTSTKVRCGQTKPIVCENQCSKILNCGNHSCEDKCHGGSCNGCEIKVPEECFCGKEKRIVLCGSGEELSDVEVEGQAQKVFSCKESCGRVLACGNHLCEQPCHLGNCIDCPLLPENLKTCPCLKVDIVELLGDEKRTSCLDAIPTCESFCGKKLYCGSQGVSHLCMSKCHEGPCKPCDKILPISCRCNGTKKEMPCKNLKPGEVLLCDRKCSKKRKCLRHKCNQKCCVDKEHNCNIICGKKLSCGQHKCDEVCHAGFCPSCWRAGFDELSCHCGATVQYPPIPCSAKPPECSQPCTRNHPCGHAALHPCHSDERCPPCAVLTTKTCMGDHKLWKNVPCHQKDVSCGQKCTKPLSCGMHKCDKVCHKGECLEESEKCQQKCTISRPDCNHPCNAPCHAGTKCPESTCKVPVTIHCRCRRKSAQALCMAGNMQTAYQSFNTEILTMQLQNLQSGQSIDISKLTNPDKRPKFLECDEECSRLERNKRFVEALGIENPDGGFFQCVIYSESLKHEARLRLPFIQTLEVIFESLYMAVKKSGQTQHVHNFQPMNQAQRKIIHELAECYGFKSYSVDPEPKRSTVVVAYKESYIPQIKLSQLIEEEIKHLLPSSLMRRNNSSTTAVVASSASAEQQAQSPDDGKTLKSILKQPSQQAVGAKRVNYFDDDFQEM